MLLQASHAFLPKQLTANASILMDHFGISFETGRHIIAESFDVPIAPGQVILFTGPSGSGKSTLMRATAANLALNTNARSDPPSLVACGFAMPSPLSSSLHPSITPSLNPPSPHPPLAPSLNPLPAPIDLETLPLPQRLLIDSLDLPFPEALSLLTSCGLGEPRLLLRTPAELSDGQRYRFKLALALSKKPAWIIADEFTATLDRTLAKVIAFNIHRLSEKTRTGFLLATTHEDITEDLSPHIRVHCHLDSPPTLTTSASHANTPISDACGFAMPSLPSSPHLPIAPSLNPPSESGAKKKNSHSSPNSNSHSAPKPIGRTSLGGITAPTT